MWQSTQLQEHVDGSMEIQRMEATSMLQESDSQNQSNKSGYSLCHSGQCGQGWVGGDWEVVKKGSRNFQHLSTMRHIARDKFGT